MKNITLSADDGLIAAARSIAASRSTTLNAEFRQWLAGYVGRERQVEAANWLADAGGTEPQIEDIPRRRSEL